MLTGKKFGALFFSTLVLFVVSSFPAKTEAQVGLENVQIQGVSFAEQVRQAYSKNTNLNTFDIAAASGNKYAITDGKGNFIVFEKGSSDNNTSATRDASKDTMIGTIFTGGEFKELAKPIPNSNAQAQKEATNSAAAAAGKNEDLWTSVMSGNNSRDAVLIQANETAKLREELRLAQEALDQQIARGEDTTEASNQVDALTKRFEEQNKQLQKNGLSNQKGFAKENLSQAKPEAIFCISPGQLSWGDGLTLPSIDIPGCAAMVGNLVLKGAAWILWTTALVFDYTLIFTLGDGFAKIVGNTTMISLGWSIFRDIANLCFIFLLLFISIGIILNNNSLGSKSMIPAIITAALLINFSLFFTKVIIDASNIVTLQFYAQMRGDPKQGATSDDATGIAAQFIKGLNLTTLYQAGSSKSADTTSGGVAASLTASAGGAAGNAWNIILVSFGGTILILITSFVFLSASILFINRAVIFILLLVTSPIAFISGAFPGSGIKGMSNKWWSKLWSQALFAPAYMALTYIVLLFIRTKTEKGNFAALFINGNADGGISTLLSFIMLIAFMVLSLTAAASFGGYGSSGIMGFGKKAAGWGRAAFLGATVGAAGVATRGVVGGAASRVANSNLMRSAVARMPGGGLLKAGTDRLAGAKFGTGKSFDQATSDKQKRREELSEFAGGSREFRSRGVFENAATYSTKRDEYQKEQKAAGEDRRNAALGVKTDENGNFVEVSKAFLPVGTTFSADSRALKLAQQKRIDELKKKGKTAKDKGTRKKGYLENVDTIIGDTVAATALHDPSQPGTNHHEQNISTSKLIALKQQIANGSLTYGGSLGALDTQIRTQEGIINNRASSPGQITTATTKLGHLLRKRDALEEKVITHLDAVDKLQQEA